MPTSGVGTSETDPGVQYDYFYQMDCPGTAAVGADGDVGDLACDQTGTTCADAGGVLLLIWYRVAGTDDAPALSTNTLCSQGNNVITLNDVITIVDPQIIDYLRTKDLDQPTISAQPASTLVNLPTVFSATPAGDTVQLTITEPMPGTLDLVPSYTWDFGDGSGDTPTVAGIPYDGTDPQTQPDHYPVLHTFSAADTYDVKVTVTWTATTLHLDGLGDFPVNETHPFTGQLELPTHEAHAVLTSGG